MRSYVFISVTALYVYTFLMLAFMSAKKSRLIRDFIAVLGAMMIWTGGSLLMRLQIWPSYVLWYYISLTGICLAPYAFFCFIRDFCGCRARPVHRIWLVLIAAMNIYNMATGNLVPPPEIDWNRECAVFVYHMTWRAAIMYGLCFLVLIHTAAAVWNSRKDREMRRKMMPLLWGIMLLFAGNLAVPLFDGFPIDILSGVLNALVMLYTLYSRHVFRMTLLVSGGNCYVISMAISALTFYGAAQSLDAVIRRDAPLLKPFSVMIVAVLIMMVTMVIYMVTKRFFDKMYVKEGVSQAERFSEYTAQVSRSLRLNEILSGLMNVINDTLHVEKIYICIKDVQGNYPVVFSRNSPDDKNLSLAGDASVIGWLKTHDSCLLFQDFCGTAEYKSMGAEERRQMENLKIECILPLKDGDDLAGLVLMGGRERKGKVRNGKARNGKARNGGYSEEDIVFLNSIESVSSIAVKNSRLYEKACEEARTDELTGLLNRKYFYEVLKESYEQCGGSSVALVIFNVDDFKLYNQLYGNQEGDRALVRIAGIIRSMTGDRGRCARYSSKEFAVVLPDCDIYSAWNLAENISHRIQNMNRDCAETYLKPLTVSCGICAAPRAASSMNELVSNADCAVYHVKHSGKNGIRVYSEGMIGVRDTDQELARKHKSMYSEYAPTIYALTAAIDAKDHYTFQHSKNVAYYAWVVGEALRTSEEYQEIMKESALLHDIGKIGIPENILNKTGKLTDEEYNIMKRHVEASVEIIRHLPSMDYVIPAVLGHHERFDGKGYPRRIGGKDIPLAARILCIADSFDAMVSRRSYKPSMSVEFAVNELEKGAGTQFDPELVPVFIRLIGNGTIQPVLGEINEF